MLWSLGKGYADLSTFDHIKSLGQMAVEMILGRA